VERPLEKLWEDLLEDFWKTFGRLGNHIAGTWGGGGPGFLEVSRKDFWERIFGERIF
jgi:hypothetical protein